MKYIPNSLWFEIEKLIPKKTTNVGRPEFDNRKAFDGIFYVLRTGCQWEMMPEKYGKYKTIHGKYMRWAREGIFYKMMVRAREYYRRRNSRNNWYAFDTTLKKAPFAKFGGKNPTDRGKIGVKYSAMVDRSGAPLFVDVFPANVHDSKVLGNTVNKMRKSKNVRIIAADSAFDVAILRSICKEKNLALVASPNARRKKNVHKFSVAHRWIVEQSFGILSWFRGIKSCWSKTIESARAFLQFACSYRLFEMAGIFR